MDKKVWSFLFFDLRIAKKNAKMALQHNGLILIFEK
jgi:hypothetical protein